MATSERNVVPNKGKVIHSQARQVIWNVYSFFNAEDNAMKYDVIVKTAQATGFSISSVKNIIHEGKTQCLSQDSTSATLTTSRSQLQEREQRSIPTEFKSPEKKQRIRDSPVTDLDDFDLSVIRATVSEINQQGHYPTIPRICQRLKEKMDCAPGASSLRTIMKDKLGLRYGKVNNRKFYTERPEIVALRREYLRKIRHYRSEGRSFVVLDETWVNEHHGQQKQWHNDQDIPGRLIPLGPGRRLIVCHAGTPDGFVPGALLLFRSRTGSSDYHHEMNGDTFAKWFEMQLLPNISQNSVIIMDNAPYHSVIVEKTPTSASRKNEMMEWLDRHGIAHESNLLKKELYDIVKANKTKEKKYLIDRMAALHGHTVLRLPPYHCDFNPIELIWAQVKEHVRAHNTAFKLVETEQLTKIAIGTVKPENWMKCFRHVVKIEEQYWQSDHLVEERIEPLIINTADDSDTASDERE